MPDTLGQLFLLTFVYLIAGRLKVLVYKRLNGGGTLCRGPPSGGQGEGIKGELRVFGGQLLPSAAGGGKEGELFVGQSETGQ